MILLDPKNDLVFKKLQVTWSKGGLEKYNHHLDAIRSSASQFEAAEKIDFAIGFARGFEIGRREAKIEITKRLLELKCLATAFIAKTTGLTIEEVEELKKN